MGYFDNLNAFMQPADAPVAKQYDTTFAPFDFSNNVGRNSISATKVRSVYAGNILAGTVLVPINLGSQSGGYVLIDGANNRILVNDGTVNRIVIGSV